MNSAALQQLFPVFTVVLGLVAVCIFMFINQPGLGIIKFVLIPSALSLALVVPMTFYGQLGRPVTAALPENFEFIGFKPVLADGKKTHLEVWVRDGSAGSRLYSIPWSHQLEEQLSSAREGQRRGSTVRVKVEKPGSDQRTGNPTANIPNLTIRLESVATVAPKDEVQPN
jgi:hypothetical protein